MNVGDLIEYRCPKFGLVTQWRVWAICLGGMHQESLVGLKPITNMPGESDAGKRLETVWVPEQLTRGLLVAHPAARQGGEQ